MKFKTRISTCASYHQVHSNLKNPNYLSSKKLDGGSNRSGRRLSEDNVCGRAKGFGRKRSNVYTPSDFALFAVARRRLL
jgi:hypothetical protein